MINKTQQQIGITFADLSLLQRALTHRSYLNEHPEHVLEDNERLEFLGDAVLDFIAGSLLYHRFPEMDEGRLTRLRAALVRTETLARFASRFHLGEALLLGRGEDESGGRNRQKNLCGAFEALVGALYLDQGMDAALAFAEPLLAGALEGIMRRSTDKDAKSLLQEWSQATLSITPSYRTVRSQGPDHAKEFTVEVLIGQRVCGEGVGHSKQTAAQFAARNALTSIKEGEIVFDGVEPDSLLIEELEAGDSATQSEVIGEIPDDTLSSGPDGD
ncbi:MAG: ribonuclease III [Chloroflexi bacterium]|nr:ribonuclease III [Chloroflexota bacterium]